MTARKKRGHRPRLQCLLWLILFFTKSEAVDGTGGGDRDILMPIDGEAHW